MKRHLIIMLNIFLILLPSAGMAEKTKLVKKIATDIKSIASTKQFSHIVDFPDGCYQQKQLPCAIRSVDGNAQIRVANVQAVLSKDAMVSISTDRVWSVLEGKAWFKSKNGKIDLPIGVQFFHGDVGVIVDKEKYTIMAFQGELEGKIPKGYKQWISRKYFFPEVQVGVLENLTLEEALLFFKGLHFVSSSEVRLVFQDIVKNQDQRRDNLNMYYGEVTQRRIASLEDQQYRIQRAKEKEQELRRQLLEKFRRKSLLQEY